MPADALPWLYGVARRVLANQRRADSRRDALARRLASHGEPTGPRQAAVGDAPMLRALAALSEVDREALVLVAWEGLDQRRVAAALGCRPGTLRVRLHRTRRRLARELERREGSVPEAAFKPANVEQR